MGCHALLRGIFPALLWNPYLLGILHWYVGSLSLASAGKPYLHLGVHKAESDEVERHQEVIFRAFSSRLPRPFSLTSPYFFLPKNFYLVLLCDFLVMIIIMRPTTMFWITYSETHSSSRCFVCLFSITLHNG